MVVSKLCVQILIIQNQLGLIGIIVDVKHRMGPGFFLMVLGSLNNEYEKI